jgi:hypothetical protein
LKTIQHNWIVVKLQQYGVIRVMVVCKDVWLGPKPAVDYTYRYCIGGEQHGKRR